MPTRIVFAGAPGDSTLSYVVAESPTEVHEALIAAGGLPFTLTGKGNKPIYVNPSTIAYWAEKG